MCFSFHPLGKRFHEELRLYLVSILPYFHAAVRCVALFYTLPKPRNRGLGRCGLTWPQMQQESTPSFRRGLSACCSCRTAVGDTNCCRRTLLSLRGRQELRYCRILCVRKAGSPCSQCVPSRHQATLSRLCDRLCLQGSSKAFLITSFPSVCRFGPKLAVVVRMVLGILLNCFEDVLAGRREIAFRVCSSTKVLFFAAR